MRKMALLRPRCAHCWRRAVAEAVYEVPGGEDPRAEWLCPVHRGALPSGTAVQLRTLSGAPALCLPRRPEEPARRGAFPGDRPTKGAS